MCNMQKLKVGGHRERHNKSKEGFTEGMTFELGFQRSRERLGGGEKGVRACLAEASAFVVLKST